MLIDFGGVKVAVIASQFHQPARGTNAPATLLGKVGYAPYEQIQTGMVYPHSDLYALAATVLVLLTGKEPQELIDERNLSWQWRQEVHLSPILGTLLDKMLSPRLSNRYQSARQVVQVLNNHQPLNSATPPTKATVAIAPAHHQPNRSGAIAIPTPFSVKASHFLSNLGKIGLVLPVALGAAGVGWWAVSSWFQFQPLVAEKTEIQQPRTVSTPQLSAAEQQRKNQLRDRRQQMGVDYKFYVALVDRAFWEQHPERRGRRLTASPEDEALRTRWDRIAAQMLDRLQPLNPQARRRLGSYTTKERSRWVREIYKLNLSSRALYDLADAAFLTMFPQERGKNFMNQPISQAWYALADEQFQAILAGTAYEQIGFDAGASEKQLGGSLKPGEGKAYVAQLTQDQLLQLQLQANPQVLISVYSPTGKIKLMEDSSARTWSGKLPESGFYEFVVVSTASEPTDYQLKLAAGNW
jgi:serine/threonine-protein kinase